MCRVLGENGRNQTDEKKYQPFLTLPAVVLAGFFLVACATPAPKLAAPGKCAEPKLEWSAYQTDMKERLFTSDFTEFTDNERLAFLWSFNNDGPETGFAPDTVGYFDFSHFRVVWLVMVEQGCVWFWAPMRPEKVLLMIARGRGT